VARAECCRGHLTIRALHRDLRASEAGRWADLAVDRAFAGECRLVVWPEPPGFGFASLGLLGNLWNEMPPVPALPGHKNRVRHTEAPRPVPPQALAADRGEHAVRIRHPFILHPPPAARAEAKLVA